jgi:hypothetical protein
MTLALSSRPHLRARAVRAMILAAIVVGPVAGCSRGGSGVRGSGTVKTESRAVAGFTHVTLAGEGDVTITQSGTESLTVEADDNLLPLITSTVSGPDLTLTTKGSVQPTKRIHYTVTVKDFSGFDLSGAGNATATQINATAIKVVLSGAGDAKISGQTQSEDVTIAGAGNYQAPELASKTGKVSLNGAGNAVVKVSDALDVRISGVGNLEYIGDPKVTQSISGVGSVRKR